MSAAVAIAGGSAVLNYMGQQDSAASQRGANRANAALTREGIAEDTRQFDIGQLESEKRYGDMYGGGGISQSMRDYGQGQLGQYTGAGQKASQTQSALLGLGTPEEQQAAMASFEQDSPGQKFMRDRAQKNLLRSSSAIGGLGGGNVRSALVEQGAGFAAQDYNNYLGQLGRVSAQGQAAGTTLTNKDVGVLGQGGRNMATPGKPNLNMVGGKPGAIPGVGAVNPNEGTLTRMNREAAEKAAAAPTVAAPAPRQAPILSEQQRRKQASLMAGTYGQ